MRRWDSVLERYLRVCQSRGLMESTIANRMRELDRFGSWLKRRRPKPQLEDVDSDLIIGYIRARTVFHSKWTICGVVTDLRAIGGFLVEEGSERCPPNCLSLSCWP